jgi:adenylylsulfate kinase
MTVSLGTQPAPSFHLDGEKVSDAAEATVHGATMWFTGLPSAGKTTIANALAARLAENGRAVEILDGDAVRPVLSSELGYSRADRDVNVGRIGWVAQRLAHHGVLVLACVVSPFAAARDGVRRDHENAGVAYYEVHVATPLAVCAERDVKGLYARQRTGAMTGLTGVDDDYEAPVDPELRIDTTDRPIDDVVDELIALARKENLL